MVQVKRLFPVILAAIILRIFSPGAAFAAEKGVMATIGSHAVTSADVDRRLQNLPEGYRDVFSKEGGREELLKEMVRIEVFSQEARALGLHTDKEFRARIAELTKSLLAAEYVKHILSKVNVSEDEAKKYYGEHRDELKVPERMKTQSVLVRVAPEASPQALEKEEAKAKDARERLLKGEDLSNLSQDNMTGSVDQFSRGRLVPEIEESVFALKDGDVSPVLRVRDGFVVFKVEQRSPERDLGYAEAKADIIGLLKQEKEKAGFEAAEAGLFSKYKVSFQSDEAEKASGVKKEDYFEGKITAVSKDGGEGIVGTFLMDITGADPGFRRASVRVTAATRIFKGREAKAGAGFDDLKAGQSIKILFDGPVMHTYPVQAKAKEVLILTEEKTP
ncbi:MAG: peptidyl-prolyl cis-trans isomerase [Deltaproteobacteria bacterium]|nr:peptidyl-prolyl cis-trans isomerase [Deltaproteobacteria bacterium]